MKLYQIRVWPKNQFPRSRPLILHYTDSKILDKAIFELKRNGFEVEGQYDYPTQLNNDAEDAVFAAKAVFH